MLGMFRARDDSMRRGSPAEFILSIALSVALASSARAAGSDDVTAVEAKVSSDYARVRLPSGEFKPETYVFAKGGEWKGAMQDFSIDKMGFMEVAHMIAYPLAGQKYIPSQDPRTTKLLLMVYWGTTHAPEHASNSQAYQELQNLQGQYLTASQMAHGQPNVSSSNRGGTGAYKIIADQLQEQMMVQLSTVSAENDAREKDDELNVMMLGYDSWWAGTQRYAGTPLDYARQDLLDEIELNRYFVVIMAYDFQLLWKEKKHKLLWETRFSIRQMHHEFDKDLPAMAKDASKYFGRDTGGLIHGSVPIGQVDIGELKSLGEAPSR
jgi:hypothetical protein